MHRLSIKNKVILALAVVSIVVAPPLVFLQIYHLKQVTLDTLKRQQSTILGAIANAADDKLLQAQKIVSAVAELIPPTLVSDPEKAQRFLEERRGTAAFFNHGLFILSREGKVVAELPYFKGRRGIDLSFREYFRQTMATHRPFISKPYTSSRPGHPTVIMFTAPVIDREGKLIAVLGGALRLQQDNFIGGAARIRLGKSGYISIISSDHSIIAHPDHGRIMKPELLPGLSRPLAESPAGFETVLETVDYRGVEMFTSVKRLRAADWFVVTHYPMAEALKPIVRERFHLLLIMGGAFITALLVVWVLLNRITSPLIRFTAHIQEFPEKTGAERLFACSQDDEIGILAATFNDMIKTLDSRLEEIRQGQEIYRLMVEFSPGIVIWEDLDHRILYISPGCDHLFGYSAREFQDNPALLKQVVYPEDLPVWTEHHTNRSADSETHIEYRIVTKQGEIRWFSHSCRYVSDETGKLFGIRGGFLDITKRKEAEQSLQKEKHYNEGLIHSLPGIFFLFAPNGRLAHWNRHAETVTGYDSTEMMRMRNMDFVPRECRKPVAEAFKAAFTEGSTNVETLLLTSDGRRIPYFLTGAGIEMAGERYLIGTGIDISDLSTARDSLAKAHEELARKNCTLQGLLTAVEQSRQEWEETMNCMGDMVVLTDPEERIRRANRPFLEFVNKPAEEVIGCSCMELLEICQLESHMELSTTVEMFHRPTESYYMLNAYPVKMDSGRITGFVITIRDVTELKQISSVIAEKNRELEQAYTELQSAQTRIFQQEKMASIGQLAAGVAHEINNPMGFISSNLGTLAKYVERFREFMERQSAVIAENCRPEQTGELQEVRQRLKLDHISSDAEALIKESLDGAERVRSIVQDLKTFSRLDEAEEKDADINSGLESTINMVWNELKYKAHVAKEFGELPLIRCNPGQLNQVFLNLLVNAGHAIEKQGEIIVRSWHADGFINVSVCDNGCGMPPDVQKRIFEPFYTTKEVGTGTGLGLAIAYDIVKKHHGEIILESEAGKGTTFTVRIPATQPKSEESNQAA